MGMRSISMKLMGLFALVAGLVVVPTLPASASIVLALGTTSAGSLTVGDTNVPTSIHVTNNSTDAQAAGAVTLSEISLWPSCKVEMAAGSCPTPDPGVFALSATGTGKAGSACAGQTFTISAPDVTGKVSFTPAGQVTLPFGAKCEINYTSSVLKMPADGHSGVGVQTTEIGFVRGTHPTGNIGTASYFLVRGAFRDNPTLTIQASPTVPQGGTIFSTASLSGGTAPTGNIVFDLFPPSDTTCLGAPAFSDTKPVTSGNGSYQSAGFTAGTAGTWRWTAHYDGDVNNAGTPRTPCAAPPAAVVVTAGPAAKGELRVTTSPALPSQIVVDGVPRDSFGLNWLDLPPGTYTVTWTHIEGYTDPAPQTVSVVSGQTTTVQGTFVRRGSLRVVTSPAVPATITVDGIPRDDWGMWTDLPAGTHAVCFGPVQGFNAPACQNGVVLTAGNLTTVTGTYTSNPAAPGPANVGELRVTSSPALPTQVLVNGSPRDTFGLSWLDLAPGSYTVSFTHIEGFTEPAPQTVNVVAGQTTTVQGNFVLRTSLRVITNPAVPATISVDGVPRDDWGMWTDIPAGAHQVCFGPVPGFVAPSCTNTNLVAGVPFQLTGNYTASP
ncbi:MAG: large repetitive protein [Actinomycetota bacterium]|nr:large repetitive protein [Actinomycetota bacterium]